MVGITLGISLTQIEMDIFGLLDVKMIVLKAEEFLYHQLKLKMHFENMMVLQRLALWGNSTKK